MTKAEQIRDGLAALTGSGDAIDVAIHSGMLCAGREGETYERLAEVMEPLGWSWDDKWECWVVTAS